MKRRNLKLFITFLIIFAIFAQWNDAWDYSVFISPSRTIVEDSTLNIDSYINTTPIYYESGGKYYSLTNIGYSFLLTPVYRTSTLSTNFIPDEFLPDDKRLAYDKPDDDIYSMEFRQSPKLSFSRFFVLIFTVSFMGSLTIIVFKKIVEYFTNNKKYVYLLTLGLGLGTTFLVYSTTFYSYIPSLFLILLSFFMVLKAKKNGKKLNVIISGLISGFAIGVFEGSAIVVLCLLVYIFFYDRKLSLYFLLSVFVGYVPYIIYHVFVLENAQSLPFLNNFLHFMGVEKPSGVHIQPATHPGIGVYYYGIFSGYIPQVIMRSMFYPYMGLFFFNPFLILFFPGVYLMYKQGRKHEALFIVGVFLIHILSLIFYSAWWGTFSFGPRRLILIIPFIALPILYCFKKINTKIIVFLIILSIGINFMGFQEWTDENDPHYVRDRYQDLKPIGNPLYDRNIPLTVESGPRSMLIENLIINNHIDIWNAPQTCKYYRYMEKDEIPLLNTNRGILTLKLPFLSIFLLLIILYVVWYKDINNHVFDCNMNINYLIIILLIIVFVSIFIGFTDSLATDGWDNRDYGPPNNSEISTSRYMRQNGTFILHRNDNRGQISFDIKNVHGNDTLNLWLNNETLGRYNVTSEYESITVDAEFDDGLNELVLESEMGCRREPEKCNLHCYSFKVDDFRIR